MSLFIRFPISVADGTLPVIPTADVDFFGTAETGALGHWLFGGTDASLTSLVGGELLTLQDPATAPTYAGTYMTHTLATGKALLTSRTEDATVDAYTLAAVHRVPSTYSGLMIPSGSLTTSIGGATFGTGGSTNLSATYRGSASSLATGLTKPNDQWFFVATSFRYTRNAPTSAQIIVTLGSGGVVQTFTSAVLTPAYNPNTAIQLALGNSSYTGISESSARMIDTAEFLVFNRESTAAAMEDLYARSQSRMAQRGITI